MTEISHIHHINFLVKDLEQAIKRYEVLLGEGVFTRDALESRSVITARTKLGETWLILVQPTSDQGLPAKHLAEHGEGFFLLSLGTDDLDRVKQDIDQKLDSAFAGSERQGLDNWRIIDLNRELFHDALLQLTEEE